MKLFSILAGLALCLAGLGCFALLATGFDMLQTTLLEGNPVSFEHEGRQWHFPGRLVGGVALAIPIICTAAGVWLLRSGFDRKNPAEN